MFSPLTVTLLFRAVAKVFDVAFSVAAPERVIDPPREASVVWVTFDASFAPFPPRALTPVRSTLTSSWPSLLL